MSSVQIHKNPSDTTAASDNIKQYDVISYKPWLRVIKKQPIYSVI